MSDSPASLLNTYLLCEGKGDKDFFDGFLTYHQFRSVLVKPAELPSQGNGRSGPSGKDVIGRFLMGEYTTSALEEGGFNLTRSTHVVIVADADNNPSKSFKSILSQLDSANAAFEKSPFSHSKKVFKLALPEKPWETAYSVDGNPSVSILVVPDAHKCGALETLCYDALKDHHEAISSCVESFAECSGANAWDEQKKSKLKLRALLSAIHHRDPDIGFGRVFSKSPNLIKFDHEAFRPLIEFFEELLRRGT